MNHTRIALSLVAVACILLFAGCPAHVSLQRRGRSAYERGDYDAAVRDAAASLRIKPAFDKSQYLLQNAFRVAVSRHQDGINELRSSTARFRWDDVAGHFAALVDLNRTVRDLPPLPNRLALGGYIVIETADFSTDLHAANVNAAEEHYQEGLRLAGSSSDLGVQRQATAEFAAAERFVPGYRDAADRAAATHRAATRRVAIIPFEDKSGSYGRYGALMDKIVDDITSDVMRDRTATEFLEIVNRDRLEQVMREQQLEYSGLVDPASAARLGKLLGVHDILTGRITQIVASAPQTTVATKEQEAEVVLRTITYKDTAGNEQQQEVKGTVKATVTLYTKTARARVSGSYSLIGVATGAVGKTESCQGTADFQNQWATYTGDKRALGQYAALCETAESAAPDNVDLVTQAAANLSQTLAAGLAQFLR
jgi:hypothetical protein